MTDPRTPSHRPEPFSAYTTPAFWDDPHVSGQMLVHHLDPVSDRASRPHAVIERSVRWLVPELGLRAGDRVLDLGCGPGLYAAALAREGIEVLGWMPLAAPWTTWRRSRRGRPCPSAPGTATTWRSIWAPTMMRRS